MSVSVSPGQSFLTVQQVSVQLSDWPVRAEGGCGLLTDSSCWDPQGLLYINHRLRELERRQQQVAELQLLHQRLLVELKEAQALLTLQASRGSDECEFFPPAVQASCSLSLGLWLL